MLLAALVAASLGASPSILADAPQATPIPQTQTRKVGEKLDYSLHALLTQTIAGKDAFGRIIDQQAVPTNVKGFERIVVTKVDGAGVTLHRSGTITVTVDDVRPVITQPQSWSLIDTRGKIVRDSGRLGGFFLLPLPFLGETAVKAGDDLAVGDAWTGKLGTRLFGMMAQPELHFVVTGTRLVFGVQVFTIQATGTVPMREPVMTLSDEALGYATGIAHISAQLDYDRASRRLVSLEAVLLDSLHYNGPHAGGMVHDHESWSIALDASSMTEGLNSATAFGPRP
ncbi:MAG TPA: hypothetical protein VEJ41_01555 [Candidatus Acidoferrales bacterium]|nr:hypothetical protein [Candidatus Acidoferrales bacterium]